MIDFVYEKRLCRTNADATRIWHLTHDGKWEEVIRPCDKLVKAAERAAAQGDT